MLGVFVSFVLNVKPREERQSTLVSIFFHLVSSTPHIPSGFLLPPPTPHRSKQKEDVENKTTRMATPTESQILTNYLLLPADLRSVITPDKFAALFPRALQASPNVQTLYRDLEQQRADAVETVRANIEAETKRGYRIRNEVAKARRREREGNGEIDDEIEIERAVS